MKYLGTISLLLLFVCLVIWVVTWVKMIKHIIRKKITKEMLRKLNIKLWIFYFLSLGFYSLGIYTFTIMLPSQGSGFISFMLTGIIQIITIRFCTKKLKESENQKQVNNEGNSDD